MFQYLSYEELSRKCSETLNSSKIIEKCEFLRKSVVVGPKSYERPFELKIVNKRLSKLNDKILLGVLHWYLPKEISVLMNLWLEENWGGEFLEVKTAVLTSKKSALGYLLVNDRWNENDFLGNILKEKRVESILSGFHIFWYENPHPKRTVRRRGYNDKGSLNPPHLSKIYDYRKFRTVYELELEETKLNAKIENLFKLIDNRLRAEKVM